LTKLDCQCGLNGLAFWPMFVTEIVANAERVETETEAGVFDVCPLECLQVPILSNYLHLTRKFNLK